MEVRAAARFCSCTRNRCWEQYDIQGRGYLCFGEFLCILCFELWEYIFCVLCIRQSGFFQVLFNPLASTVLCFLEWFTYTENAEQGIHTFRAFNGLMTSIRSVEQKASLTCASNSHLEISKTYVMSIARTSLHIVSNLVPSTSGSTQLPSVVEIPVERPDFPV